MKKIRLLVAIGAALMIAAPAMALEVEVSGHYFVEYFNNSNPTLSPDDATDDYATMEFMAQPVFKINDNITLTTQFTALQDHVWGGDPVNSPFSDVDDGYENFDWKAAYMTIKSPIGGFIVGRYIDTPWGLTLGDTTASHGSNRFHKDRIMWVIPTGDFISGLVAQKNVEEDKGTLLSDQDFEKYYAFSAYKKENWSTGLLASYYNIKSFVDQKSLREAQTGFNTLTGAQGAATLAQLTYDGTRAGTLAATGGSQAITNGVEETPGSALNLAKTNLDIANANVTAAAIPLANGVPRTEAGLWVFDPYFKGDFGPFYIGAELVYGFGKIDLDGNRIDPVSGETFDQIDAKALLATVDLKYNIAGFTFEGGYTYVQGDSDYSDDETNAAGYLEPSVDLEHGFLLTSDIQNMRTTLGGTDARGIPLGNLAGGPTSLTGTAGYQMFFLGGKYQLLDNLKLGVLYVNSKADDAPYYNLDPTAGPIDKQQWDDDHGSEWDFTLEWEIMQNLRFWGVVAYLDAGDFWKQDDPNAEIKDNTTVYGRLTLTF